MGVGSVSKELELGAQTGTGGPALGWRIHQARRRTADASAGGAAAGGTGGTTGPSSGSASNLSAGAGASSGSAGDEPDDEAQGACSVLVYEKGTGVSAGLDDPLLDLLRRDAQALSRLRHPLVLGVSKLDESARALLVQTSEPVVCSLANLLRGQHPELAQLLRAPLAAKLALAELADVLLFVHERARLLLPALPPECVFVTRHGRLRLAGGLCFALPLPDALVAAPLTWSLDGRGLAAGPELAWAAPELVLNRSVAPSSDAFVLGLLAHALLLFAHGVASPPPRPVRGPADYQQLLREVAAQVAAARAGLGPLPSPLADALEPLLVRDWAARADLRGLLRASAWAADVPLQAVLFSVQLHDKSAPDQRAFFRGLLDHVVLPQVPVPLLRHVLLPSCMLQLRRLGSSDPELAGALVACAVQAGATVTRSSSPPDCRPLDTILRFLSSTGLASSSDPTVHLALLQHLDALLLASTVVVEGIVIPDILLRALAATVPRVLDTAVKQMAKNVSVLPADTIRLLLLPRLMALSISQSLPPLPRANCLVCAQKLATRVDPATLQEIVLPSVEQLLQTHELLGHPGLIMAAFCLLEIAGTKAAPEVICARLVPIMAPILLHPALSTTQLKQAHGICETLLKQAVHAKVAAVQQPPPKSVAAPVPVTAVPAFHEVVAAAYASKVPPGPAPTLPPPTLTASSIADYAVLPVLPPPPSGMGLFSIHATDASNLPPPLLASPQYSVSAPHLFPAHPEKQPLSRTDAPSSFQNATWNNPLPQSGAPTSNDAFSELFFAQPKETKKQM